MTNTNEEYLTALAAKERAAIAKAEANKRRLTIGSYLADLLVGDYLAVAEEREKSQTEGAYGRLTAIDTAISIHRQVAKPFLVAKRVSTCVMVMGGLPLIAAVAGEIFDAEWNSAGLAICGWLVICAGIICYSLALLTARVGLTPGAATAAAAGSSGLLLGIATLNQNGLNEASEWAWPFVCIASGVLLSFGFNTRRIAKAFHSVPQEGA